MNKILILDCDLHREKKDNTVEHLIKFLSEFSLDRYAVHKMQFPKSFDQYTHIIISGSNANTDDNIDWVEKLKEIIEVIVSKQINLLGICFGHQIIANHFNAEIIKMKRSEYGIKKIRLIDSSTPLFKNVELPEFFEAHDYIVDSMPEEHSVLAENGRGIQALTFNKNTFGIQFHLEIGTDYGERICEREKVKLKTVNKAVYDSSRKQVLLNFLNM